MNIAFDIGGVISRFPEEYKALIKTLAKDHTIFIITDMNYDTAFKVCKQNGILEIISGENILCADWAELEDNCKAALYQRYNIDVAIDDRPDYINQYPKIALCPMPRPETKYINESWIQ